jgi:hypothetical protein
VARIAALYLVALKRDGATWSRQTRLWFRLKAAEQVLLLLFVGIAAVGFPVGATRYGDRISSALGGTEAGQARSRAVARWINGS